MAIDDLKAVLAPPGSPIEAQDDWSNVEARVGSKLPQDYKELIQTYGTGCIDEFLWVLNPFATNRYLNLLEQRDVRLSALRVLSDEHGERIPYRIHPEFGGVLPCAFTDNGDVVYWLTKGDPLAWTIVVNESRGPDWEEFASNLTDFLIAVLQKRTVCRLFPEEFPTSNPEFLLAID